MSLKGNISVLLIGFLSSFALLLGLQGVVVVGSSNSVSAYYRGYGLSEIGAWAARSADPEMGNQSVAMKPTINRLGEKMYLSYSTHELNLEVSEDLACGMVKDSKQKIRTCLDTSGPYIPLPIPGCDLVDYLNNDTRDDWDFIRHWGAGAPCTAGIAFGNINIVCGNNSEVYAYNNKLSIPKGIDVHIEATLIHSAWADSEAQIGLVFGDPSLFGAGGNHMNLLGGLRLNAPREGLNFPGGRGLPRITYYDSILATGSGSLITSPAVLQVLKYVADITDNLITLRVYQGPILLSTVSTTDMSGIDDVSTIGFNCSEATCIVPEVIVQCTRP